MAEIKLCFSPVSSIKDSKPKTTTTMPIAAKKVINNTSQYQNLTVTDTEDEIFQIQQARSVELMEPSISQNAILEGVNE